MVFEYRSLKNSLPLAYHSQEIVVKNDDLYIQIFLHDSSQLLDSHLDTTVAGKETDRTVRRSQLRSNGGGKAKAHRSQTS